MRRMPYHLAAAALAAIHLAFILFVIFGGFAVLRWPVLVWIHVPAAVWGVLIEWCNWYCPLTKWENYLLQRAGRAGYSGGFVAHYIMPVIYPAGLTRGYEIAIGAFVLVLNAGIYMRAFR
jgi:hypothetical protein